MFHAGRRGCIVNVVLLPAAQSQTLSGEKLFRDLRLRGSRLLIVSPKRRWVCHHYTHLLNKSRSEKSLNLVKVLRPATAK